MEISRAYPSAVHAFDPVLAVLLFILKLTITNVWRVLSKQEMPHNTKQMGTYVIRGSVLYFLCIVSGH